MANKFFTDNPDRKLPTDIGTSAKQKVGKPAKIKMGKMNVAKVGKTQPKSRTLGIKEIKIYNAKQGLAG